MSSPTLATDFCVSLLSSCPGVLFHLLSGGLRSLLDGHTWFVSGLSHSLSIESWWDG